MYITSKGIMQLNRELYKPLRKQSNRYMVKDIKRQFIEAAQVAHKHTKKCSALLVIREI